MRGKLSQVTEFALIAFAVTLTAHAVASPAAAPEAQAPMPTAEQIEAAVAYADAQAEAVNGRR